MSSDPFHSHFPVEQSSGSHTRAAIFVWILGVLQFLMGGCLSMAFAMAAVMPPDRMLENLPQNQRELFTEIHPSLPLFAVVMLLLIVLPGVTYIVLGFFVRMGHRTSIRLTLGMVLAQASLLVIMLLLNLLVSLVSRDLLAILANLLLYGVLLAFMAVVFQKLWFLRAGPGIDDLWDTQTDPWDTSPG